MQKNKLVKNMREYLQEAKSKNADLSQLSVKLAAALMNAAFIEQTGQEISELEELSRLMDDEKGKYFLTAMTDQCFRSDNEKTIANQITFLLNKYQVPSYLLWIKRLSLKIFKAYGNTFPGIFVPLVKFFLRHETANLILPGERDALNSHMQRRRKEGVRINLNRLGEAILGEKEAERRFNLYLEDLRDPLVEYISIKISTIYSQINLIAWEETLEQLSTRFRALLREAAKNPYVDKSGKIIPKFINLDMEEYRDLALTVELFKKVLSEEEFLSCPAGIVLQAYLPDSFGYQQELTEWSKGRIARGGVPVKIRIVKGANLAMEKVEASLKCWPQAPFEFKSDVDANFLQMIDYAFDKDNAAAVTIGVGSHNIFDIAYALVLSSHNGVENKVSVEMLEGMADPIRRVVQSVSKEMLLYCPASKKEEFQNAVAYLVRRLDENTAPENFLRHSFNLKPGTAAWENEQNKFIRSVEEKETVGTYSRRTQSRFDPQTKGFRCCRFENEADTDFSLLSNRRWTKEILKKWKDIQVDPIPLMIGGKERQGKLADGYDPSLPGKTRYQYHLASLDQIEESLNVAESAFNSFKSWPVPKRSRLLLQIADRLRAHREDLIGVMMVDAGKTIQEADVEVSEAIDFAEYYAKNIAEFQILDDVSLTGKGPVLVLPPWNFPCAIPAGGCLAALAAGCSLIFKPPQETVWVSALVASIFWEAGVPKDVMQFVVCEDDPEGSHLVRDKRIKSILLTGASETARKLTELQSGFDLFAETGGKNSIIVSNMSDRDLAVKDIIQSAFGHAGQKCSACSVLVLHKELYDDPHFKKQLRDAAKSLKVGPAWQADTKVNPLIHAPSDPLKKGLTELEPGEEWLLKPEAHLQNPALYSPGIKWGVKEGSFSHLTEFFGPLLSVIRADNLSDAIRIANGVPYGLTSGIHSLDEREVKVWENKIIAGNLYVNRGITGAIVHRQPFGGTKESQFGPGAKAGGPNYVLQMMHKESVKSPEHKEPFPHSLGDYEPADKGRFQDALSSYAFFWTHYFSKRRDGSLLLGQDNIFYYVPHDKVTLRLQKGDHLDDVHLVRLACQLTETPLEISADPQLFSHARFMAESDQEFLDRMKNKQRTLQDPRPRVRLLTAPSALIEKGLKEVYANVHCAPVSLNGRIELIHYLREVSLSRDYHRYGNLGDRELEERAPLVASKSTACGKAGDCCGGKCRCGEKCS